jgi:SH3-like domain-containing protein
MLRTLPILAKLCLPLLAFGGIGLAVLPADFKAVQQVKAVVETAPKQSPSFNVAPMRVEAIIKAPAVLLPLPAPPTATPTDTAPASTVASASTELTSSTTEEAATSPAAPENLSVGHVNSAVNVREDGRKGSSVLFVLPAGSEVRVAESNGGWVHIHSDQGGGWIFSSFLGVPRTAPVRAADNHRMSGKILRVAGRVTVRDLPSGAPLFKLEDGEAVRVVATDGNWARIETSNGDDGWVRVR